MTLYLGSYKVCPTITVKPLADGARVVENGVYTCPTNYKLPDTATDLAPYIMLSLFQNYNASNLVTADMSSLINISYEGGMTSAFIRCSNLISVNLSNLTSITGASGMEGAFAGCTRLATIDLSSLANINASSVLSNAFDSCTSLTSLSFPSLTSTSFGSYTNQFNRMLYGVTGCTVHFPSNLQSVIGSWASVTAGFNGTNTTILFDLEATE